jgi:hypothetical protein
MLQLIVVTSFKSPVTPIINPTLPIVTPSRDNINIDDVDNEGHNSDWEEIVTMTALAQFSALGAVWMSMQPSCDCSISDQRLFALHCNSGRYNCYQNRRSY